MDERLREEDSAIISLREEVEGKCVEDWSADCKCQEEIHYHINAGQIESDWLRRRIRL